MKNRFKIVVLFFSALILSGCVATTPTVSTAEKPAEKKWVCSAANLVTAEYKGGTHAYVHLSGYSRGDNYPVTKNGSVATGKTGNGTVFTCNS